MIGIEEIPKKYVLNIKSQSRYIHYTYVEKLVEKSQKPLWKFPETPRENLWLKCQM